MTWGERGGNTRRIPEREGVAGEQTTNTVSQSHTLPSRRIRLIHNKTKISHESTSRGSVKVEKGEPQTKRLRKEKKSNMTFTSNAEAKKSTKKAGIWFIWRLPKLLLILVQLRTNLLPDQYRRFGRLVRQGPRVVG